MSSVSVRILSSAAAQPNNVYALLQMRDRFGTPLASAAPFQAAASTSTSFNSSASCWSALASQLELREDGRVLSAESFRCFVPQTLGLFRLYVQVVVDQSKSVLDANRWSTIAGALIALVQTLLQHPSCAGNSCRIAISAFDGRATLRDIVSFTDFPQTLTDVSAVVNAYNASADPNADPGTDLYSAILNGLSRLAAMEPADGSVLLTRRALVLFTDGVDTAARHSAAEVLSAVDAQRGVLSFAVGEWLLAKSRGTAALVDRPQLIRRESVRQLVAHQRSCQRRVPHQSLRRPSVRGEVSA